jgi:hypothetical protein
MTQPPKIPQSPDELRDTGLDETIEDTFPASDPPSTIPDPEQADQRQPPPAPLPKPKPRHPPTGH